MGRHPEWLVPGQRGRWLRAVYVLTQSTPPLGRGQPLGSWGFGRRVHLGEGQGNGWEHRQGGVGLFVLGKSRVIPGADMGADSPGDQVTGVPGGSGQSVALWPG